MCWAPLGRCSAGLARRLLIRARLPCLCWTRPTSWSPHRDTRTRSSGYSSGQLDLVLCYTHHAAQLTSPCFAHSSRTVNPHCQKALFSDTYNEAAMQFALSIVLQPYILLLKKEKQLPKNIKHFYVKCCNEDEKFLALANIYGTITVGHSMIFCRVSKLSDCGICWIVVLTLASCIHVYLFG